MRRSGAGMTRPAPCEIDRRRLLAGAASLLAAVALPAERTAAGVAAVPAGGLSLGELAAAKGLLFGASFATHELDKPYGASYAATYAREARMVTSELELKLYTMRPKATALDFGPADRLVLFAREHGLALHGHNLIWNDALPDWIRRLGPDEAAFLMDTHITTVLERYRADIPTWDVVNEPIAPWDRLPGNLRGGVFYAALGEGYIAESFRVARRVAPQARLFLNEAQTESDDENGAVFRASLLALAKRLKAEGAPVDGIGLECHLDSRRPYDFPRFAAFVEELAAEGFEIAISELDVNDVAFPADPAERDRKVADVYRRFLAAVLPVKAVRRLTLWQIADHTSWMYYDDVRLHPKALRRPRPLPFDERFRRKAAWSAIAEALDAMPPR